MDASFNLGSPGPDLETKNRREGGGEPIAQIFAKEGKILTERRWDLVFLQLTSSLRTWFLRRLWAEGREEAPRS